MLVHGLQPRHVGAIDKVRSVVAGLVAPENLTCQKIADVMQQNSFIHARAHEMSNMLYTTSDMATAQTYALQHTHAGGEFASHVQRAMGVSEQKRFDAARPVLLTLNVPEDAIIKRHGEVRADTYEVLVKARADVKIASVTFAAKDATGHFSFVGQPALSQQEALDQILPVFTVPIQKTSDNSAAQKILKTINDFTSSDMVDISQDHKSMYVAEARMLDAEGYSIKVRVPDPLFQPRAIAKFDNNGFTGVAQNHVLPHDLTAMELNAFLTVLDIQTQKGIITPAQKAADIKMLLTDIENANPVIKSLIYDRNNQFKVEAVVQGVVNSYSAINLQHHVSSERMAGYADLKKATMASIGVLNDIDLAPATLKTIDFAMAAKLDVLAQRAAPPQTLKMAQRRP